MPHYNVLFLCTGNSSRSIMAEAIMNRRGGPTFTAYSAGSHPSGSVRPEALRQIAAAGLSPEGYRSKSWEEFTRLDSPHLSFVFTVCDNAAQEVCPIWPGQPMTAHWGIPDPGAVDSTPAEIERAYKQAFIMLATRISLMLALPLATMDSFAIKKEIDSIGKQKSMRPHIPGDIMQTIIFACVHNAGRSQMAAAFFNQLANPLKARAVSAGTEPDLRVHPEVLEVMKEVGIDLRDAKPKKLTAQLLITMGCGDKCPYVPGLRRDDWPLQDPKGLPMKDVRAIRDGIKSRVQTLLANEGLQA
jgi:arsenate reductase